MEPTLFGYGKAQWELWGFLANWFGAIGSISAALAALYIANRGTRPRARLSVQSSDGHSDECVTVSVANIGDRNFTVVQIGWRTGWLFWKQTYPGSYASDFPLPVNLAHGETHQWKLARNKPAQRSWYDAFASELGDHYVWALFTLRAVVFTSHGRVFSVKPDANVICSLRERASIQTGSRSRAVRGCDAKD